jgi:hypothetical protein
MDRPKPKPKPPILKKKVVPTVSTPDVEIECDDNIYYIHTVNHWSSVKLFMVYHNISFETMNIQGKIFQIPTSDISYEFDFLRTFTTWLKNRKLSCSVWHKE